MADLKRFLTPVDDEQHCGNNERIIDIHKTSGFCVHRVSAFDKYQTSPFTYSGKDVMDTFYTRVFNDARVISDILLRNVSMKPLTDEQQASHDAAIVCHNCKSEFTTENPKTHHHCHVTGAYLFPACNACNLALKPRKDRVDGTAANYLVRLIMHNMGAYC